VSGLVAVLITVVILGLMEHWGRTQRPTFIREELTWFGVFSMVTGLNVWHRWKSRTPDAIMVGLAFVTVLIATFILNLASNGAYVRRSEFSYELWFRFGIFFLVGWLIDFYRGNVHASGG
jgi:hypothetical protein